MPQKTHTKNTKTVKESGRRKNGGRERKKKKWRFCSRGGARDIFGLDPVYHGFGKVTET